MAESTLRRLGGLVSGFCLVQTTSSEMTTKTKAVAGESPRFTPDVEIYGLGPRFSASTTLTGCAALRYKSFHTNSSTAPQAAPRTHSASEAVDHSSLLAANIGQYIDGLESLIALFQHLCEEDCFPLLVCHFIIADLLPPTTSCLLES